MSRLLTQLMLCAGHLAGLVGCVAVILTARLVQRAFVLRNPVSPRQITDLGIASIVAWSIRLFLFEAWSVMYNFMESSELRLSAHTVYYAAFHAGFILAGVLLLQSREKPVLAKAAQALQTVLMLVIALLHLGQFSEVATFSIIDFGGLAQHFLLSLLPSVGLAVYPTMVWTQVMLRPTKG